MYFEYFVILPVFDQIHAKYTKIHLDTNVVQCLLSFISAHDGCDPATKSLTILQFTACPSNSQRTNVVQVHAVSDQTPCG